jgi:hypothetical protein
VGNPLVRPESWDKSGVPPRQGPRHDAWTGFFAEDENVFDEVKPQILKALTDASFNGTRDVHAYAQVIRRTVGRWVNTQHRRRPMIIPVVIEA